METDKHYTDPVDMVNALIRDTQCDTGRVSDGFHTFNELYDHRNALFITLLRFVAPLAWKSRLHSDGTRFEGFFVAGVFHNKGLQITYHLPDSLWEQLFFVPELVKAPEYDGHSSHDVIQRLVNMRTGVNASMAKPREHTAPDNPANP